MSTTTTHESFSAEEREAMKARRLEANVASAKGSAAEKAEAAKQAVLAKIAEMDGSDRIFAERVHDIISTHAPALAPKLWYGMPAYALDGKILCHFQPAAKFKTRYATLTFSDQAHLDDRAFWPVSFALGEMTAETESRIAELLGRALS